ncbi:MAG: hypothetical protein COA79_06850 [Planctomycetota bacterium]|nr:MAG: hypothetical protein COA79_06850 [Planctomycetota bacterium]
MNNLDNVDSQHFKKQVIKGLLYREWLQHKTIFEGLFCISVIGIFVLLIISSPAVILIGGIVYACILAHALAGADIAEGSEEFAFSLPITRLQRFWVRLTFGGLVIFCFCSFSILAIGLNLPQLLWGLFVETGMTEPFSAFTSDSYIQIGIIGASLIDPPPQYPILYCLQPIMIPTAVFILCFSLRSISTSKTGLSWLLALFLTFSCFLFIDIMNLGSSPDLSTDYVVYMLLATITISLLLYSANRFSKKEGLSRPAERGGSNKSVALVVVVIVLFVLAMLFFATMSNKIMEKDTAMDQYEPHETPTPNKQDESNNPKMKDKKEGDNQ